MEKNEAQAPSSKPVGICEKMFNALKMSPSFRPLGQILYRPETATGSLPKAHAVDEESNAHGKDQNTAKDDDPIKPAKSHAPPTKENVSKVDPTPLKPLPSSLPKPPSHRPVAAAVPAATKPAPPASSVPTVGPTKANRPMVRQAPSVVPTTAKPVPIEIPPGLTARPFKPATPARATVGPTAAKPATGTSVGPLADPNGAKPSLASPALARTAVAASTVGPAVTNSPAPQLPRAPPKSKPVEGGQEKQLATQQPARVRRLTQVASNINEKVGDYIKQAKLKLSRDTSVGGKGA